MAGARQRIVIDLNNKAPVATVLPDGGKRWPRVLALLAFVFVIGLSLLAAAGFFWWQKYKTRPAYSLALMMDAARRDDAQVLEQLIDADKIAENLLSELSDKAAARYGSGLAPLERQRVQTSMSVLLPVIKQGIKEEATSTVKELAAVAGNRPFLLLALAASYTVEIAEENDAAVVRIPGRSNTQLTMMQSADRWQIVSLKDNQIVERLVDRATAGLPPLGQFFDDRPKGTPPGLRRRRR